MIIVGGIVMMHRASPIVVNNSSFILDKKTVKRAGKAEVQVVNLY